MTSIPEEFTKVLKDFVRDIKTTFPEYESLISKWWKDKEHFANIAHEDDRNQAQPRRQTWPWRSDACCQSHP
jgi:hypothetical protein